MSGRPLEESDAQSLLEASDLLTDCRLSDVLQLALALYCMLRGTRVAVLESLGQQNSDDRGDVRPGR